MRKLRVLPSCRAKINKQIIWYLDNAGMSFVKTMTKNLNRDFNALAFMPTIGKKYKFINGRQYYTFPSKKKADIIYWMDDETLYIVDVIFYFAKQE